ncbi:MAG: hypothetical protein QXU75_08040 [Candidatus Methanomethylicaceae archaeon]
MVWQVILCGLLAVSESGDWSSFLKAEQLFHEVYGKKIEAAKTPEAKAALARELLELAKKETDQLAKRVELEQAKRLAVEANAIAIAIETVKELAKTVRYDMPTNLIDEAERLWQEASADRSGENALLKLEAIELFFRSESTSSLFVQKWRARIDDLIRNKMTILNGREARLVGQRISYDSNLGGIASWFNTEDYAEWFVHLDAARYTVRIYYAIKDYAGRSIFAVIIVPERAAKPLAEIPFRPPTTGSWMNRQSLIIGTVSIRNQGKYYVRIVLLQKANKDIGTPAIVVEKIEFEKL